MAHVTEKFTEHFHTPFVAHLRPPSSVVAHRPLFGLGQCLTSIRRNTRRLCKRSNRGPSCRFGCIRGKCRRGRRIGRSVGSSERSSFRIYFKKFSTKK